MDKQPSKFRPGDKVGILYRGKDIGRRGVVREVTIKVQLTVDPEPGGADDGLAYFDDAEKFFIISPSNVSKRG